MCKGNLQSEFESCCKLSRPDDPICKAYIDELSSDQVAKLGSCTSALQKYNACRKDAGVQNDLFNQMASKSEQEELAKLMQEQKKCDELAQGRSDRNGFGGSSTSNNDCVRAGWKKDKFGTCRNYAKQCPPGQVLGGTDQCVACPNIDPSFKNQPCVLGYVKNLCGQCIMPPNGSQQVNSNTNPNDDIDRDGVPDIVDRCVYPGTSNAQPVWREGVWLGCYRGQVPNRN